jgi:glycosyltransferase involved in cell wall biosynthesis
MKISILLPYKENYSKEYAGAVSIFINGVNKVSKYKYSTKIFGNTEYKNLLSKNYYNIPYKKRLFQSSSKIYVNNFINLEDKIKSDIIEIHNRPNYLRYFKKLQNRKFVIYFHNDPLSMAGSTSILDRFFILNFCHKIVFNSEWTKNRFFNNIDKFYSNSQKVSVIYQSTNKANVDIKKKEKIITFVGKLNKSKGYDIFGNSVIKILNEFKSWKVFVSGDEPREKIMFTHKRFTNLGYQSNKNVLNLFKKSSIAVACSRWEEPFGRSSLEASSRGCAVIISNKGGLPETITDGIILKKLNSKELYKEIKSLIMDRQKMIRIQNKSIENFYLDNKYISNKIDSYRSRLFDSRKMTNKDLKILHITNFNERHDGRLFYNTGRRINNGFTALGHTVQTLSDRDIISQERKFLDITGSKKLNKKLIDVIGNFTPNLIVLGHADQISNETIIRVKKFYPHTRICQWFLDKMDDNEWLINKKRFTKKISFIDASFCTTHPDEINLPKKHKIRFIPNPVDNSFENLNIFNNNISKYDVFFALSHGVHRGSLKKGKFDNREFFLKKLINMNNEVKFNIFGIDDKQPIWAENFKKELSESKMALNLSQGSPLKFYSSDRIAQLVGNGILTFIDIKTKLNKIFTNKEVVFYKNIKDLSKKILIYKDKNTLRKKIAKNGMLKYHKHMNSKKIASYIINKTLNLNNKEKFFWENK